jgi:hypothetical protein
MSCLTKICFLFRICHLLHRYHPPLIPPLSRLINLRMLHIRLCYCLTTVQVPDVALPSSSLTTLRRQDLPLPAATSIAACHMQRARAPRSPSRPRLAQPLCRPRDRLDVGRLRPPRRLRVHRPRRHGPPRLGWLRPPLPRPSRPPRLGRTRQCRPRLRLRRLRARLLHRRLPLPTRLSMPCPQHLWFPVRIRAAGAVSTGPRNALMALLHGSLPAWLTRSLVLLPNPDTIKQQ